MHFCIQALDILGCLPDKDCCGKIEEEVYINREAIVEWIYGLQTLPTLDCTCSCDGNCVGGGFKGGTFLGPLPNATSDFDNIGTAAPDGSDEQQAIERRHPYDHSHLAMTYVALCTLAALGDDLSRINKTAILSTLQSLQKEDGSFVAISSKCNDSGENIQKEDDDCDLRFMYTAIAVWYLLTDPPTTRKNNDNSSNINIQSATSYILSCICYDGGIGLTPGREGHGGSTFCGIASLYLMGVLDETMAREEMQGWRENLIRWCVMRQYHISPKRAYDDGKEPNGYHEGGDGAAGMQGRPNKLQDTCYSYWIGGTLHLLSESHLLDGWALREYVLTCQSPYGGFGKVEGAMPDLLHSFYSLAWLALSGEQGCCDEDFENDEEGEGGMEEPEKVVYDSEMRQQVYECVTQLSKLDCALGICTKRKTVFQNSGGN